MSSLLSTGTKRRNSPAWCKKGMFVGIIPTINGKPRTLNAYAYFLVLNTDHDVELNEMIPMRRNDADTGWQGDVTIGEFTLVATMADGATSAIFHVQLTLLFTDSTIAVSNWIHHQQPTNPRWDTGTLTNVVLAGELESALHILG